MSGVTEGDLPRLDARPDTPPAGNPTCVIYVVRHGEAGDGTWPLPATAPLSPAGRAQARRAAGELASRVASGTRIFASDLLRCRETAETIVEALQGTLVLDHRLRELDFGWEALDGQEVLRRVGEDRLARFLRDPAGDGLPGAEHFLVFWERVRAAAATAVRISSAGEIVLVAHDGVNRALSLLARGLGPKGWPEVPPWRHGEVRALAWPRSL